MRGSAGKIFATTLLYYVISFYEFLQHDHNLIKLNFDLLTSSLGCGDSGVCGQNICFHVSALVIPFNLICIMIIYFKLYFDLLTPTPRSGGGGGGVCRQNIWFHVAAFVILFFLICYMTMF